MCLVLLAWRAHARFPLVVAANRDEFHDRPTAPAAFWGDRPHVLGGRDLEAMGTWLGVSRDGRFAAVSNFRDGLTGNRDGRSRGLLARNYLEGTEAPADYVKRVQQDASRYRPFNLIVGDRNDFWWLSNRGAGARRLDEGTYGLSNHLLDTPWPKVVRGKSRLEMVVRAEPAIEPLLELLGDTSVPPAEELPDTGVGPERERLLAATRIVSPLYGTRSSSAVIVGGDGRLQFAERRFDAEGSEIETLRYELRLAS